MKKELILALAVLFVAALAVSVAGAAPNVGNTTQKGSVLVFPKVQITGTGLGAPQRETFITISNDYYADVNIKCYWRRGPNHHTQDFTFKLTANQPAYFQASTGQNADSDALPIAVPPFEGPDGMLLCFAVDAAGANSINWNHLYGTATVIDYSLDSAYAYNSWNFAARAAGVSLGGVVGTPGKIALDGVKYDACPQYLLVNFPSVGAYGGLFRNVDLTLVPCKVNVKQDTYNIRTKAQFDLWNENEVHYTGVYQCIRSWFEGLIDDMANNGSKFRLNDLHSAFGRFRVTGVASTVCRESVHSPLIGLAVTQIDSDSDGEVDAITGVTGNAAGIDASGFVKWDAQSSIIPESVR